MCPSPSLPLDILIFLLSHLTPLSPSPCRLLHLHHSLGACPSPFAPLPAGPVASARVVRLVNPLLRLAKLPPLRSPLKGNIINLRIRRPVAATPTTICDGVIGDLCLETTKRAIISNHPTPSLHLTSSTRTTPFTMAQDVPPERSMEARVGRDKQRYTFEPVAASLPAPNLRGFWLTLFTDTDPAGSDSWPASCLYLLTARACC